MPLRHRLFTLLLSLSLTSLPLMSTSVSAQAFDLEDLQQQLAATPSLAGSFEQRRELADLDSSLKSQGTFIFERARRVVWQLETPVQERIELTPEAITNGSGDDAPPGGEQVAQLFLQLLEGDWQALESRFALTLSGNQNDWQVALTPESAALRERIAEITLRGARYIERLELRTPGGDRLQVHLFDQHPLNGS